MVSQQQFCITKPRSYIISKDDIRERLNYAIQLYKQVEVSLLIKQAAELCAISKAILYYRINSHRN